MIGLALLMAAAASGAVDDAPAMPDWMTGCWHEEKGEDWSHECWTRPRGGVMLGAGSSGSGERVRMAESLRIEPARAADGSAIRLALRVSQGGGWTTFAWSPSKLSGITFVNAGHDYPQRIRYWREGGLLMAEIAQIDGSGARSWRFVPGGP